MGRPCSSGELLCVWMWKGRGLQQPCSWATERAGCLRRRVGWVSFWSQLALCVVSAVVLSFTVGSQMQASPSPVARAVHQAHAGLHPTPGAQGTFPGLPIFFTLGGVAASFISTFLAYSWTRQGFALHTPCQQAPREAPLQTPVPRRVARKVVIQGERVAKSGVLQTGLNTTRLNLIGLFTTLIGLQARRGPSLGGRGPRHALRPAPAAGVRGRPGGQDAGPAAPATRTQPGRPRAMCPRPWTCSRCRRRPSEQPAGRSPAPGPARAVAEAGCARSTLLAHCVSLALANWLLRKLNAGASAAPGSGQFKTA